MVVDGVVHVFPASAGCVVTTVSGDAMTGSDDACQLLDIQMQHVAGGLMLVAWIHRNGLQIADSVELQTAQDAAYRGTAQASGLRDAVACPTLPPQLGHTLDLLARCRPIQPLGTRSAVGQPGHALLPIPPHPLGRGLRCDVEAGRGQLQRHTLFKHFLGYLLSTMYRQSGILVVVHSVSP